MTPIKAHTSPGEATVTLPHRRRDVGRIETGRAICGGRLKNGGLCKRKPGQATDHPGLGRCDRHGGLTQKASMEALTRANAYYGGDSILRDGPVMGMPMQLEPVDALTWCVTIASGELAYLNMRVHQLQHEEMIARPRVSSREMGTGERGFKDFRKLELGNEALHIVIVERQKAIDRLARLSKMALDAGVAERQVRLAEAQGDMIVELISGLMEDLGLTRKQKAILEQVLPARMLELEAPGHSQLLQ